MIYLLKYKSKDEYFPVCSHRQSSCLEFVLLHQLLQNQHFILMHCRKPNLIHLVLQLSLESAFALAPPEKMSQFLAGTEEYN